MKAVLISIQPKWCGKISTGEKTLEVRKTAPKLDRPFKVYIYQTKHKSGKAIINEVLNSVYGGGKVIGEFVCNGIMRPNNSLNRMAKESLLTEKELFEYSKGKELFGWRISDLKIYEKPKKLKTFNKICPYKKPDGTRMNVECPCDKYSWDFDEESKKAYCTRRLNRPPQSWCYVEEIYDDNA